MARFYQALEIQKDGKGTGKYHFTVSSDEEGWCHATGYCADGCPGHDTPEEADKHYRQYLFEQQTRYGLSQQEEQRRCQVCNEWTIGRAISGTSMTEEFVLCEKHNNAGSLRPLFFKEQ